MNIGFMFNSDDEVFCGSYGYRIFRRFWAAPTWKDDARSKRFCYGDLLTFGSSKTYEEFRELSKAATDPCGLDLRIRGRLEPVLGRCTIYIIMIQNIVESTARSVHNELISKSYYLGAIQLDFSSSFHFVFFRNKLIEGGKVFGNKCTLFYAMGDEENTRDIAMIENFEANGFVVSYEDSGGRRTIFDDYDKIDHFRRIERFRKALIDSCGVSADDADDIVHSLEEVHPRLFDALSASFKVYTVAETSEDFAQVALSIRRYLKMLTDVWFAPKLIGPDKRQLTDHHVKNRFWAYLEEAVDDKDEIKTYGKAFDFVWDESSKLLHSDEPNRDAVLKCLREMAYLTAKTIDANPSASLRPYSAYKRNIMSFYRDILGLNEKELF